MTMKLVFGLLVLQIVAVLMSSTKEVCESKYEGKIVPFNLKAGNMLHPCEYRALNRQQCGKYYITLSPGNKWVGKRYYLDTLWMHVEETMDSSRYWEGRTSNRIVFKVHNGSKTTDEMFNKRGGLLDTAELFKSGWDGKYGAWFGDRDDNFKIFFIHWDPNGKNGKFMDSRFHFECYADMGTMSPYPDQFCGNTEQTNMFKSRGENEPFNLPDRFAHLVIYHDVFADDRIVHTNEKCKEAVNLFSRCDGTDQKMLAIKNCHQIISSDRHIRCVSQFSCDPMDVFNACIKWACTGTGFNPDETELCRAVGEGIDLCPPFANSGNLTERMKAARCYKEYLSSE